MSMPLPNDASVVTFPARNRRSDTRAPQPKPLLAANTVPVGDTDEAYSSFPPGGGSLGVRERMSRSSMSDCDPETSWYTTLVPSIPPRKASVPDGLIRRDAFHDFRLQ